MSPDMRTLDLPDAVEQWFLPPARESCDVRREDRTPWTIRDPLNAAVPVLRELFADILRRFDRRIPKPIPTLSRWHRGSVERTGSVCRDRPKNTNLGPLTPQVAAPPTVPAYRRPTVTTRVARRGLLRQIRRAGMAPRCEIPVESLADGSISMELYSEIKCLPMLRINCSLRT